MQEKSFSLPRKKVEPPLVLWMCSRSSTTPRISIIAARVNDSGGGKVQTQPETVMEAANNVHSFTHTGRQAWRGSHLCNLGVGSSLACLASCIHMQKTKPQSPRSGNKKPVCMSTRGETKKNKWVHFREDAAATMAAFFQTKQVEKLHAEEVSALKWPLCFHRLKWNENKSRRRKRKGK